MKTIYASKMFMSSSRKSSILAAMQSTINMELVKQLEDYLDDEYKPIDVESETNSNPDTDTGTVNKSNDHDSNDPVSHNTGKPAYKLNPNLNPGLDDDLDSIEDDTTDNLDSEIDNASDAHPELNSASSVSGLSVTANTVLQQNPLIVTQNMFSSLVGEIKGTLNSRSNTNGANRVLIKNDELWIYYNDDINLNSMMPNVIDVLSTANYYYLSFNRLARTDNAIVFDLSDTDTFNTMAGGSNEK